MVSFIDDYSNFAVVYPLRKKSEVFEKFQEYSAMATAACGTKISKLTVDQGREYFSNHQKKYYKSMGIQVEPTVAYSPQQNGVAERYNRTLTEKVRTMLIGSNAPKSLWSEAALAAVYIINRCPTSAISRNTTPAEIWYGSKPSLEKIRVFGCLAFAWVPNQQRKKLDAKSRSLFMVGYAPNGYRLWDKDSKQIIIARDVKFNEQCFPWNKATSNGDKLVISITHEQEGEECDEDVTKKEDEQECHEDAIDIREEKK